MEKRFIVTDHNYINTGGNCMASVFTVYDYTNNISRFVVAGDEGFSWQTADTITGELRLDSDELIKKIVIGSWQWDALVVHPLRNQQFTDNEFELFKYCQFEYIKKDCKHFGTKWRIAINELPTELYNKLTDDYRQWAESEGADCLTDGYDVFMDPSYEPPVQEDCAELKELKDFKKWMENLICEDTSDERLEELYDSYITIAVAGNSIKLMFDAENYNNVLHAIERAIEEF